MTSLGDGGEGYPKLLTKNDTGEGMLVKSDVTKPKKNTVSFPIIPVGIVLRKDHG